jgi:hypothetical protein
MNNNIAEVAQGIKYILNRDGFCKGITTNSLGQHCFRGAYWEYTYGDFQKRVNQNLKDLESVCLEVIAEQFPERDLDDGSAIPYNFVPDNPQMRIVHFNNHRDTTLEDWNLVLDKVIANG